MRRSDRPLKRADLKRRKKSKYDIGDTAKARYKVNNYPSTPIAKMDESTFLSAHTSLNRLSG